jgi:hypothetical protein
VAFSAGLGSKSAAWAQIGRDQAHESFGLSRGRWLGLGSGLSPSEEELIECIPTQYSCIYCVGTCARNKSGVALHATSHMSGQPTNTPALSLPLAHSYNSGLVHIQTLEEPEPDFRSDSLKVRFRFVKICEPDLTGPRHPYVTCQRCRGYLRP